MPTKKVAEPVDAGESLSGRLGEFGSAVMQIADEKGLSKERVLEVVEAALAAAYKKASFIQLGGLAETVTCPGCGAARR